MNQEVYIILVILGTPTRSFLLSGWWLCPLAKLSMNVRVIESKSTNYSRLAIWIWGIISLGICQRTYLNWSRYLSLLVDVLLQLYKRSIIQSIMCWVSRIGAFWIWHLQQKWYFSYKSREWVKAFWYFYFVKMLNRDQLPINFTEVVLRYKVTIMLYILNMPA